MTTALADKPVRRIAPGPRGIPLLGSALDFTRNPIRLFQTMREEYGDLPRFQIGPSVLHVVIDPTDLQYVLQQNHRNYVRGKYYKFFNLFMGDGLLTTDGDFWLKHRRLAQPTFQRQTINTFASSMTAATTELLEGWQTLAASQTQVDIVPEMMRLSLSILGKTLFSRPELGEEVDKVLPAAHTWIDSFIKESLPQNKMLPKWVPTLQNRSVHQAQRSLNDLVDQIIQAHQDGTAQTSDFISTMLNARTGENGETLSYAEIRDETKTLLLAGHETLGVALSWVFYALSQHPQVQEKLEEELDRVLVGRTPTIEDLDQLTYTKMVVDEVLRHYPPVWGVVRDAVQDDEIGGYHIPAGSTLFIAPYVTQHHPDYWENPDVFDPERFSPAKATKRPRYAYFPFGGGPRQCIGNYFAVLQMQLVLATISQQYRFTNVPSVRVEFGALLSLRPVNGVVMRLERRQS